MRTSSSSKAGREERLPFSKGSDTKAASTSKCSNRRSKVPVVPVCSSTETSGCFAWNAESTGGSRAPAALSNDPNLSTPRTVPLHSSCSARSAICSSRSAWPSRVRPASVSTRPRPWRLNSVTPRRASNCLIRVVTLEGTRWSWLAARVTPPSLTTQRKMSRSSRFIILILRSLLLNNSVFNALLGVSNTAHDGHSTFRYRSARPHALAHRQQRHRCAGGCHGYRPFRLHAADAADAARRHPHGGRRRGMGGCKLHRLLARGADRSLVLTQSTTRSAAGTGRCRADNLGHRRDRPRFAPLEGRAAARRRGCVQCLGAGLHERLGPGGAGPATGTATRRLDLRRRGPWHCAGRHARLARWAAAGPMAVAGDGAARRRRRAICGIEVAAARSHGWDCSCGAPASTVPKNRSEERRVGREGRSRG